MNFGKDSPIPPLPREEWVFTGVDLLPPEHSYFCFTDEYGRNVKCIRDAFEADKKIGRHFDQHGNWHFVLRVEKSLGRGLGRVEVAFERIDAPPGFPHKPYLKRHHIITDNAYAPLPPPAPKHALPPVVSVTWGGQDWLTAQGPCPHDHVYFLGLDWIAPDTNLEHAFAQWLKVNRPPYGAPEKRTGKTERVRWCALLKALGVYRLVRHYGTVASAFRNVASQDGDLLRFLYRNEADWYRAYKQTDRILQMWEQASVP